MPLARVQKIASRRSVVVNKKNVDIVDETETTDFSDGSIEEGVSIEQLINIERSSKNLRPLKRSAALDKMAQKLVNILAESDDCSKAMVKMSTLSKVLKSGYVGQNIEVGKTLIEMHETSLEKGSTSLQMMLNKDFRLVGAATAQSKACPSYIYMVQLYRGKSE